MNSWQKFVAPLTQMAEMQLSEDIECHPIDGLERLGRRVGHLAVQCGPQLYYHLLLHAACITDTSELHPALSAHLLTPTNNKYFVRNYARY